MCSERVSSSCSTSGTRRIALIIVLIETNDVITYNYVSGVLSFLILLLTILVYILFKFNIASNLKSHPLINKLN
jgi:hypothetical protein